MKNLDPKSALIGALILSTTLLLSSAAQDEKPNPDPMQEALKALTAAQVRQAVAWETLAEKGWPTPQNISNSFAGGVDFPGRLLVHLSGAVDTFVH